MPKYKDVLDDILKLFSKIILCISQLVKLSYGKTKYLKRRK